MCPEYKGAEAASLAPDPRHPTMRLLVLDSHVKRLAGGPRNQSDPGDFLPKDGARKWLAQNRRRAELVTFRDVAIVAGAGNDEQGHLLTGGAASDRREHGEATIVRQPQIDHKKIRAIFRGE